MAKEKKVDYLKQYLDAAKAQNSLRENLAAAQAHADDPTAEKAIKDLIGPAFEALKPLNPNITKDYLARRENSEELQHGAELAYEGARKTAGTALRAGLEDIVKGLSDETLEGMVDKEDTIRGKIQEKNPGLIHTYEQAKALKQRMQAAKDGKLTREEKASLVQEAARLYSNEIANKSKGNMKYAALRRESAFHAAVRAFKEGKKELISSEHYAKAAKAAYEEVYNPETQKQIYAAAREAYKGVASSKNPNEFDAAIEILRRNYKEAKKKK